MECGFEVRVLAGRLELSRTATLVNSSAAICAGARQHAVLAFPAPAGLPLVSRYQLVFAILMFLGSPAWIALLLFGSVAVALAPTPADFMRWDAGIAVLILVLAMWFAPNIATVIDVLARAELRSLYGGGIRFGATSWSRSSSSCSSLRSCGEPHTFLMRLLFGRTVGWGAQARDDHRCVAAGRPPVLAADLIGLAPVLLAAAAPSAIPPVDCGRSASAIQRW
jgi:membrane glycosyltransferase